MESVGMKTFDSIYKPEKIFEKRCVCNIHGVYKAICSVFKSGLETCSKCPECAEEEARLAEAEEKQKQQERLVALYKAMNIEPEFYDKTFDDFVAKTESQKKALEAVRKMVEQKHGKVILLGTNGVGKTLLASVAVKLLGGRIYSMYEISVMIRQSYTVRAERSELEIVNELASVPFLAIDELSRTKGSDAEQNWLSYVLDKRHSRGLPFMLMGNVHFRKLCKDGGCPRCFENFVDNDILSRLRQDSSIVVIDAPDERMCQSIFKEEE